MKQKTISLFMILLSFFFLYITIKYVFLYNLDILLSDEKTHIVGRICLLIFGGNAGIFMTYLSFLLGVKTWNIKRDMKKDLKEKEKQYYKSNSELNQRINKRIIRLKKK
jgi:hypothetical protein